jgi:hypothetical protein
MNTIEKPSYSGDVALLFFGGASAILLAVSMPATYAVVAPFHNSGDNFGIILALGTLLAFEIGAVGCKLVTLAIPTWAGRMNLMTIILLGLTTLANYWNGYDLFARADLAPSLAAVRTAGYGWLVALVYAATIPVLLFVFLSATVARAKQIDKESKVSPENTLAAQRDKAIVTALEVFTKRLEGAQIVPLSTPAMPALPEEASGEKVEEAEAKTYSCPHCNAPLANGGLIGLAKRYGHCAACKPVTAS